MAAADEDHLDLHAARRQDQGDHIAGQRAEGSGGRCWGPPDQSEQEGEHLGRYAPKAADAHSSSRRGSC